ncbi:MAG: glycosyltransferase [Lachnospiraceae bacterium]|nr:glycosyltransferase [Lachnospiraceae bacterium]
MDCCKVSVIVPSLNVVPYIRKCMDSILNQTLKEIEVFAVDAASTDGTHEILEEYARMDRRVTLLEDTQKSTGFAKNLGIVKSRAPYIAIVESDDYIALDMLEKLYEKAEETGADIVKANYSTFVEEDGSESVFPKSVSSRSTDYNRLLNLEDGDDLRHFTWVMYEWLGIYRKDFLMGNHILHNESKGASFQDTGFWFLTFTYAKSIYLMDNHFYFYRKDNPYASMKSTGKLHDICAEYDYIKRCMGEESATFHRISKAFYHGFFHDNLAVYERIGDELKPELLNIMAKTLRTAWRKGQIDGQLYVGKEWKLLKELLESPDLFYKNRCEETQERERNLQGLLNRVAGRKAVIVFGAGNYGSNLAYLLKARGVIVTCFSDNDERKHGKTLNGIPIESLQKCMKAYANATYLVANELKSEEIKKGLTDQGIKSDQIIICMIAELTGTVI